MVDLNRDAAKQTALERQDLSCTYLSPHELESEILMNVIIRMRQQMQTCDFFAILCEGSGEGSLNIRSVHVEGSCTVRLLLLFLVKEGHPFAGLVRHGKVGLQQCR